MEKNGFHSALEEMDKGMCDNGDYFDFSKWQHYIRVSYAKGFTSRGSSIPVSVFASSRGVECHDDIGSGE